MAQQGYSTGGGTYVIGFGTSQATFTLPNRTVTLSELQRLKRHFVIVHKKVSDLDLGFGQFVQKRFNVGNNARNHRKGRCRMD